MSLITLLYRLLLLAVLTFVFVVLFDHGTDDFAANAAKEFGALTDFVGSFSTASSLAGERH